MSRSTLEQFLASNFLTSAAMALVSVVQREWAAENPARSPGDRPWRADLGTSITVEDVLNLRMIAHPFRITPTRWYLAVCLRCRNRRD